MGGEGAECGPHPEELPGRERTQTHTCGAVIPQEGGDHCTLRVGGHGRRSPRKGRSTRAGESQRKLQNKETWGWARG